jgi:O-antigen/teichoic acid export membrane protein
MAGITDEKHKTSLFARALRVNSVVVAFGSIVLFIIAPFAMHWLFGAKFDGSIAVALWMIPAVAIAAMGNHISGAYNNASGKPHYNGYASATGLVVSLVVGIISIPKLGLPGAVLAASSSYLSTAAFMFISAIRKTSIRARDLIGFRRSDFVEVEHVFQRLFKTALRKPKA